VTGQTIEIQLRALQDKIDLLSTKVDAIKKTSDRIDAAEEAKILRRAKRQFWLFLIGGIVCEVYLIASASGLI